MNRITGYRLESPGRLVRSVVIIGVALLLSLQAMVGGAIASDSSDNPVTFVYVTVQPGDSMWSLAERFAVGQDPRDWILEVSALNGLTSVGLFAGQQIAIP